MKTIQVIMSTTWGIDSWDVELAIDRAVGQIIQVLRKDLDFNMIPDKSAQVSLLWSEGNRFLGDQETLEGAGVIDGHTIVISHEAEAGGVSSLQSVFISYSRKDRKSLERLRIHLKPLERSGVIDAWADDRIRAGDNWKDRITEALKKAKVAVLLISADFLASDFIIDNELPPLLSAARMKGTTILPVILSYCRFKRDEKMNIFQAVNDPDIPVITLGDSEQDRIYDLIANEIETIISRNHPKA